MFDQKRISYVRWNNNTCVDSASNWDAVERAVSEKRYSKKERKIIKISKPHLINEK